MDGWARSGQGMSYWMDPTGFGAWGDTGDAWAAPLGPYNYSDYMGYGGGGYPGPYMGDYSTPMGGEGAGGFGGGADYGDYF